MFKIVTPVIAIVLFFGFQLPLSAEIRVGILKSVSSNAGWILLYRNAVLPCRPYGITVLEDLPSEAADGQKCNESVAAFFRNHPHIKQYGKRHLHTNQSYHFDHMATGECILYANGAESYSEMVLKNGLGRLKSDFDDKEWNAKFRMAQQGAEKARRGMYESNVQETCKNKER